MSQSKETELQDKAGPDKRPESPAERRERLPIGRIARIALRRGFPVQQLHARIGVALGHQREGLVQLGIDAGGVQQRVRSLRVVGLRRHERRRIDRLRLDRA